jgi:uncharacterized protein YecA (UPF0149 family)
MSWGERSCRDNGSCEIATMYTCNTDCEYYTWDGKTKPTQVESQRYEPKGRNDFCSCGSGKKSKKCCRK